MKIINSLLNTDLYKLTQAQVVFHSHSDVVAEYKFVCRTPNFDFRPYFIEIACEIHKLKSLSFKNDEIEYLDSLGYFKEDFIEMLHGFKLDTNCICMRVNYKGELNLRIKGNWLNTILFEVPILAIISQVCMGKGLAPAIATDNILEKLQLVEGTQVNFVDFGTRRRYSQSWHDAVIRFCRESPNFIGTSNVYFAKMYDVPVIGTVAHEIGMAYQVLSKDVLTFQSEALQAWADEYRGQLGIALTDVIGIDSFLKDFDLYFAKLYDGLRQDSGDPVKVGMKIVKHYEKLGIDPKTKKLIFSDGLTFPEMIRLESLFGHKIQTSFGIGTNLTNDCGVEPLSMVIKLVSVNNNPVCKISDSSGKNVCEDPEYIKSIKELFDC